MGVDNGEYHVTRFPAERYKLACTPIKDSDQPAQSDHSVFDGLSMGYISQGSNVSSGEQTKTLISDCVDGQTRDLS